MQICKEFPTKWNKKPSGNCTRIVAKTTKVAIMDTPPCNNDTDENADSSGFYELAAGVNQSGLVFLLSLIFSVLGLLLLALLNPGGTDITHTRRILFGTLSTQSLSAFLASCDSFSFGMVKTFHGGNTPFNLLYSQQKISVTIRVL